MQYENVRLEELEKLIPNRRLFEELRQTAQEANPGAVLQAYAEEKLLGLFMPDVPEAKLNSAGYSRLLKARQLIPFGVELRVNNLALFLYLLTEKLGPREKAAFIKAVSVHKSEMDLVPKLKAEAKKLERELRSPKITKPSHNYLVLSKAPGEEILYLYLTSGQRLVQDRIKNYLQKYLPAAQEITDKQVAALGVEPGTPKFRKLKEELIVTRVDGRVKKPAPPEEEALPAPPAKGHPLASHARGR